MNEHFTSFADFKRRYPIRPHDETMSLGSGSYGKVVKVEDQLETEWVAIKISEFKGTETKSLQEEIKLAQKIPRQANIARYDACYRFETDTSLCDFAVMKYYRDGNLATLLKNERLSANQIYDLTRGILLGLQHLHKHRIVHRDFKPANILISRDNEGRLIPKIADFGLSKLVGEEEVDSSDFDLSDGRGTPSYKAPEQIEGSRVSFNLDLWAFGVILYEIMTGEKPFQVDMRSGSEQAIRRSIELKIMSVELPARINSIAEPYQRMLRRCLVRDIHQRVRKETELLDLLDQTEQRLTEAQQTEAAGNYELARRQYEELLHRSPDNAAATSGRARCLDKNRPVSRPAGKPANAPVRPTPAEPGPEEPTDVFSHAEPAPAEDLLTDVFVNPTDNPVTSATSVPSRQSARPTRTPVWQYLVPAALVLAGFGGYRLWPGSKSAAGGGLMPPDSVQMTGPTSAPVRAGLVETAGPSTIIKTVRRLTANAPTVVDLVGFMRGKGAGQEASRLLKTWNMAAKSGASTDQEAAITQVRQASKRYGFRDPVGEAVVSTPVAVTTQAAGNPTAGAEPVAVKPPVEEPKPTEPRSAEPDPAAVKQAAQQEYDQLIEKGAAAISARNDKTGAISLFSEAHQLAGKHELSTAKGREKYAQYMGKGNRIFDNDGFEGAKEWFLVAQSLNNTAEVKSKIKLCSTQ